MAKNERKHYVFDVPAPHEELKQFPHGVICYKNDNYYWNNRDQQWVRWGGSLKNAWRAYLASK